jgi:putative ABC transport system permease protein
MIFVPLRDLQEIAFRQGQVTLLDVKLSPSLTTAQIETIKTEIEQAGPLLVTPTDELLRNDRNLTIMKAISRTVSLIALTMGTLGVINVLLMAVLERIGEIGIMMALGWTRIRIMTSIVIEGVLIGFGGCFTGVGMAYGLSFLFTSAPIIGEIVSFRPAPGMVLPTLAISIVLCSIGSIYPAWRAASMNPTDALRRI